MKIVKYPDNSSYAVVDKESKFTFRINNYEDLWHLNQTVDALNNLNINPTITIPNLIDAQADRRFNENESSGLKLVCELLNKMDAKFKIFHPHNAEVVEALIENVQIIDNSEFVARVITDITGCSYNNGAPRAWDDRKDKDNLSSVDRYNNLVLLFPDGGAYKWGAKLADKIQFRGDVLAAAKNRKFIDGKSVLTQQLPNFDYKGKDVLIIDDICIYGGTFKGLAKLLKEQGCGKLYLATSHMTIQNFGKDNVFEYFDKVFTTNSKFDNYFVPLSGGGGGIQPQNLTIIKMF